MKRYRFLTILLVSIAYFNTGLYSQTGFLKIVSPDTGLTISINDSVVAKTPSKPILLTIGRYRLVVSNPQKGLWRHNDWTKAITIKPADTLIIEPEFTKNFIIRTNPFDAGVYLNDQYIGATPLYCEIPDPANAVLLIKKLDYEFVTIKPDTLKSSTIVIDLTAMEDQPLLILQSNQHDNKVSSNKKLIYSVFAVTLASGFTAAYLKDMADKKYNQYLSAGSLSKMDKYYNDSKRLDMYSSVSLGLFEVSFVVSLYYLIKKSEY